MSQEVDIAESEQPPLTTQVELRTWRDARDMIEDRRLDGWIFRGQQNIQWPLLTTLERSAERTASLQQAVSDLDRLSRTDALTGSLNYRGFRETAESLWREARAAGKPLSVLALDIDYFKRYNDLYGHAVGDLLLRAVAARLRSAVRGGDLMARLGGDEFAAVIAVDPAAEIETAQVSARLRDCFAAPFDIEGHSISVGVSIGSALWPRDGSEIAEVFRRADEALYRAKREQHAARQSELRRA